MSNKSKHTDTAGKQPVDQVAQAKADLIGAGSKPPYSVNGKDITHGGKEKVVAKKKQVDEDEIELTSDAGAENATDPVVLAQAESTVLADASAAGSASPAAGAAGAEAGAGSSTAATASAAGFSDAALGTIILGGVVGVAVIASTGGVAAVAAAAAPTVTGFTLSGIIALGKINDATGLVIEAFKADGTLLVGGTGTVNNDGTYTIAVTENYSGPVLIRLKDTSTGTNYIDEGTGVAADLTTDLRVMVNVSGSGGSTISVMLTPLTELAVRELVGDSGGDGGTAGAVLGATVTTTQVTAANDAIKTALGLTGDIVTTAPATVDDAGFAAATTAQQAYGQVLAAIAGAEANLTADTGTVLNTLAQGISGSTVDQAVIDLLITGATTADGVVGNATGAATALTTLIGGNISLIDISADTGSATDFITQTAAQTITARLDAALTGTKLWGSVDGGTTWTDISSFVTTTTTDLSWTGVTLSGSNSIKLAVTANTVTAFNGATASVVGSISTQSYSVDTTAPAFTSAATGSFAENGTGTAYTAAATDAHLLAYTKSGADTGLFNLDPNSGAVTFISAPNFEVPTDTGGDNVYDISVTATDGAGNSSTQAVAITVTNANEAPTLTSGATATFAENATGTVHTVTATDPDAGTTLTYALAGADAARFAIDANTGAVTFAASPNYEAPTDTGANNIYDITVTASDGTNTTAAQAVAITVMDVNEAPSLTSGTAASFAENGTGTAYTVTATDPENAALTYALAGTDATLFSINATTGAVTFATAPNFEAPADAGGNNVYDVTVTASDGTNTTAAQAVAITVTNVNEAPTLTSGATSTATLAVNQAFSNDVSGLFSDVDAGNVFSYSATGLPTGISIAATTGVISGTPTATGTVPVVITATDSGGLTVSHTVTVNVVTAPVITGIASNVTQAQSGDALTFTATISEIVTVDTGGGTPTLTLDVGGTAMTATYTGGTGTAMLTFTAIAPAGDDATVTVTTINLNGGSVIGNITTQPLVDTTTGQVVTAFVVDNSAPVFTSGTAVNAAENQTAAYTSATTDDTAVSYTLGGTDASLFNIANGAVTFATAPNFEVPTDNGTNGVYDITVTATDALGHATNQNVAITVTNVNEAPALTSGATSTATLAVNQAFSEDVSGLFADPDAGTTLTYAATGLPSGVSINTSTGVISGTPTATGTVDIIITASDGALTSASHTVTVTVVTAPVITNITANVAQATNGDALVFTATISEAVTVTGTPTLTLDVGGTAMTATYTGGTGTAALTFTATTPATGDDATVTVTAINLNGGTIIGNTTTQPLVTSTTGQVVSSFVVDNSNPVFTSGTAVNAAENQTAAYTSATTDGTAVTYTKSGTDAGLFNINATTGAVTFATAPNFEVPTDTGGNNVYDVTVTATDALGHATSQAVAITVTNVNEVPTSVPATSTATIVVNQPVVDNIANLFADVDTGDTLTYTQTGLPVGMSLDGTTGALSGSVATPSTGNAIVFTATDSGGLSVSHTVTVDVVTAPTITSTIDNVTNFDVTSNIVLTASENVTAVTNKYIHIINDGGTGFHGEATVNTQDILVTDTTKVTITNNTITINPGFDLDLSNNYHITVDAGAFVNAGSVVSAAVSDSTTMNFSTVTPGAAAGGVAGAAASQKMVDGTDALVVSYGWWDIETLGSTVSGSVSGDLSAGNIAVVFKDYDPLPGDAFNGYTGIGSPGDDYVSLTGFGSGDLLYIDNQTNAAPNDLTQTAIIHSGVAPSQVQFDGYTPNGGQPIWVDITTTAGTTAFDSVAGLQSLLSLAYVPIVSA